MICILCGKDLHRTRCPECFHLGRRPNETILEYLARYELVDHRIIAHVTIKDSPDDPRGYVADVVQELIKLLPARNTARRCLSQS